MAEPVWVSFILSLVLYRYGIFLYSRYCIFLVWSVEAGMFELL